MICGPKGSGKSSYTRLLVNGALSRGTASHGVALLDIDPGQPEYSPPGNVALVHLRTYNLGPPFSHPTIPNGSKDAIVRAHHVGAITPRDDPYHYTQCVVDLFRRYQELLFTHPSCSLIINCCGWILGSGLEILVDLIRSLPTTDVVYMSTTGPGEVLDVLQQAAKDSNTTLHCLPSQPYQIGTRTAADLRLMQTLSYFHLDEAENGMCHWDPSPIHTMEPMSLNYAGPKQDILGIMILGEEINTDFIADVIDGSVLGLCVIEHESALPEDCFQGNGSVLETSGYSIDNIDNDIGKVAGEKHQMNEINVDSARPEQRSKTETSGIQAEYQTQSQQKPSIQRTKEDLPYLFTGVGSCIPLDPIKTRCIGQVLVRGIDKQNKILQVITPLPEATLDQYRNKGLKLVLVRGKLDIPAWAYQEEYVAAMAERAERARWRKHKHEATTESMSEADSESEEEAFDVEAWVRRTPWVTVAQKGRHRRDRVWKVRRNLQTRDRGSGAGGSE